MSHIAIQRIQENINLHLAGGNATFLDLGNCKMKKIPELINECFWLTELSINDKNSIYTKTKKKEYIIKEESFISNFWNAITGAVGVFETVVKNEYSKAVDFNDISDISQLSKLKNLKKLDISFTKVSDISSLSGLKDLEEIYFAKTNINDINPLANLTRLRIIDCSYSRVRDLWPISKLITNNRLSLNFTGCSLVVPPIEFINEGLEAIKEYFEEIGDNGERLNEVKVILLGDSSSGKTSLVKRLTGENFDIKESQTHGIRIKKAAYIMQSGESATANFWDFGGQEVMHATHQFFLSHRSIYLILLNSRNDDQVEKWLKHAASFGGSSPIIVVLNKIDENPSYDVNRKSLKEKYPQIRTFFRISCKDGIGIDDLLSRLISEIDSSNTRLTPFPKHWLGVKEHFANMKVDYIQSTEYSDICIKQGVIRKFSQDVLLQYLHDLGVLINFRNLKNFDTQILNPLWLTNGVYRIINSKILVEEKSGILHEDDFDLVINDERYLKNNAIELNYSYPKEKLQYIIRVMQEFELCYVLPDSKSYVIPQLLPVQEENLSSYGATIKFVIDFPDFLPDSLFPRLMVKLHPFIQGEKRWRTGMILHKLIFFNAYARIKWDKEDQKIMMEVTGEERRRLLSFIRETTKEIIGDFTNLKYLELVPIPESKDFIEYEALVDAEKAAMEEIRVWQVKKNLKVKDLLNGIEDSNMRDSIQKITIRAFVSYSHKDIEYLKELRSALSPLVRLQKLQIWDDRDINAGDEWQKVIFQQLEESDIVICLISSDFVASDFCYTKEFVKALEYHNNGEKVIIPIMLRETDWQDLPISEIQGSPGQWITSIANRDESWAKVSKQIRGALEQIKKRKQVKLTKVLSNDI